MIKRSNSGYFTTDSTLDCFDKHRQNLIKDGNVDSIEISERETLERLIVYADSFSLNYTMHLKSLGYRHYAWEQWRQYTDNFLDREDVKQNFDYFDLGTFVLDTMLESYNGCFEMEHLISEGRLTVENADDLGNVGLDFQSAFHSTEEALEYLAATKAFIEKTIEMGANIGNTPQALLSPDPKIVSQALDRGADINAILTNGQPILASVFENARGSYCMEDRLNAICEILNHNPDMSLVDNKGKTVAQYKAEFEKEHQVNLDEYRAINTELKSLDSKTEEALSQESLVATTSVDGKV